MLRPDDPIEYLYFDMDSGKEITRAEFDQLRSGTVHCSGISFTKPKPVLFGFTRKNLPLERLFNLARKRTHASTCG